MAVHGCVCAGEPRTEPGHGPPFCSSTWHLSALSLWNGTFSLLCYLHLSPDENVPGLKQCLLPKEGAFVSSPSPPLLSFAPSCFMLLPTKLIKINMFLFASIGVACNLADGGVLLEGQQLHTSGSALGKSAWKKPQAQHTHT